jgi:hypothetical protein
MKPKTRLVIFHAAIHSLLPPSSTLSLPLPHSSVSLFFLFRFLFALRFRRTQASAFVTLTARYAARDGDNEGKLDSWKIRRACGHKSYRPGMPREFFSFSDCLPFLALTNDPSPSLFGKRAVKQCATDTVLK